MEAILIKNIVHINSQKKKRDFNDFPANPGASETEPPEQFLLKLD